MNNVLLKKRSVWIKVVCFTVLIMGLVLVKVIVQSFGSGVVDKIPAVKNSRNEISFDDIWSELAKKFNVSIHKNIDVVVDIQVKSVTEECTESGIVLTDAEMDKLKTMLRNVFGNIDYGAYLKGAKGKFLKKTGKTEEEINNLLRAARSKKDIDKLNNEFQKAAEELGQEFWSDPTTKKQLTDTLEDFYSFVLKNRDENKKM